MCIRDSSITASLDGFVAGPQQSREVPLGEGGEDLHRWMFEEPQRNAAEVEFITSAGAYIMGRNMFGPVRGEWDEDWRGWWGEVPPYHAPVYVLTHHPHDPVPMEGGTTFHFVTDGVDAALGLARESAGDRPVSIAGGASTVNQYLAAGLIDELRLHVAPILLGAGARIFDGVTGVRLEPIGSEATPLVTHTTYRVVK